MKMEIKCVIFLLLLQSCLLKNQIDKEAYYIPEGFTGKVLVLFNCKDGKPEEWINGRRLYKIPPSGVLKTQFKPNTGRRNEYDNPEKQIKSLSDYYKFYYVDKKGDKTALNYIFYYGDRFKVPFKNNDIVVTGDGGIFGFGAYETYYKATVNYVFKGKDSNLFENVSYTGTGITDTDWCRINHWNTYNTIKDTICNKL